MTLAIEKGLPAAVDSEQHLIFGAVVQTFDSASIAAADHLGCIPNEV
jgi:hypothetical protein